MTTPISAEAREAAQNEIENSINAPNNLFRSQHMGQEVQFAIDAATAPLRSQLAEAESKLNRSECFAGQLYTDLREGREIQNRGAGLPDEVHFIRSQRDAALAREKALREALGSVHALLEEGKTDRAYEVAEEAMYGDAKGAQ